MSTTSPTRTDAMSATATGGCRMAGGVTSTTVTEPMVEASPLLTVYGNDTDPAVSGPVRVTRMMRCSRTSTCTAGSGAGPADVTMSTAPAGS